MEILKTLSNRMHILALCIFVVSAFAIKACDEAPFDPIDTPFALLRVMWNGDASTQATIGWSSVDEDAEDHILHLDTIDHGNELNSYRAAYPVTKFNDAHEMTNNFVHLQGLHPDTKYYFVISNGDSQSPRYWFQTSPDHPSSRLSLIAGGDSRNNEQVRMAANRMVAKLNAHAVIFGGDYTFSGTASQWKRWLQDWQESISFNGRITPIIPARGNHEGNNEMMEEIFDTPKGVYFASQLGGDLLRVYTLNSEISIAGDQTDWLKEDLKTYGQETVWRMAQYHKAISPHTKGKTEREKIYTHWAPLFYKHGVELVSESDSHTMKTTWPLRPSLEEGNENGFVRDDKNGTIFIGEGCWGAPLRKDNDLKTWTRDHGQINHFFWIFLDKDLMEIRTVQVDNVDQVETLNEERRFSIPENINIYSQKNDPVIQKRR